MKIAVFGASGRTGILTVYQALDKGHFVTAFSRKASHVTIQHPKITVVEGDVLDYEKVKAALQGNEAVLIALGVDKNQPTLVLSDGTANILKAMKECGVHRLICMSSAGILGNDTAWLFGKFFVPLFLNHVFKDKVRQMNLIRESGLEWVIVRPPRLTLAPKTGAYQITQGRPATKSIPRADVADFMLKLLTQKKYDGQMPSISSY
ncbi:MAG: SDR family oxidoreductase [bacterium]